MIGEAKKYQAFYTKSTPIVDYMVSKLDLQPEDKIFEPCGGDGVFIEAILEENEKASIDVCELNPDCVKILKDKFSHFPEVKIRQCDTLLDNDLIFNSSFGGIYSKIIANPPYGAWQDYEKRDKLKKLYPNLYAKETYALFLFRCIELLKDGGMLSFIIPDTFLNLHMHKSIRKHILTRTKIVELALFPSSFFPGVNFGYANLSIITLQKCDDKDDCLNNHFKIINNFDFVEQLGNLSDIKLKTIYLKQFDVFHNPDYAFLISENTEIIRKINSSPIKIGDIASCVTGFYSGDDKNFLKVLSSDLKNGKNYELVDLNNVRRDFDEEKDKLEGLAGEKHFIPIVKGGNKKYLKPECWFMNWSKEAVSYYKFNKRSRFQNPSFYFRFGIGVPMISSSSITASLIENKLFDQSIVGIFPKDPNLTFYLLGFFNSPTCNKIIRTINPSANNPANYIKKIPFIMPEKKKLDRITELVKEILNELKTKNNYRLSLEYEIHDILKNLYDF